MTADPDTCQSCAQPLVWVHSARGRPIPCDPAPRTVFVPSRAMPVLGDLVAVVTEAGTIQRGYDLGLPLREDLSTQGVLVTGRVSHFATCPERAAWRGRRRTR